MKKIFDPPNFDDPEKLRQASMTYRMLWVMLIAIIPFIAITLFLPKKASFFIALLALGVILVNLWLIYQRQVVISGHLTVTLMILAVTVILVVDRQRVHDTAIILFPMIILLSGLFIGSRAALFYAGIGILCIIALYILEIAGWISKPEFTPILLTDIIFISVCLAFTGWLVYTAVKIIGSSMRALQKRERELRQLNQELEERITQRTEQIRATNNELQAFSYSVSHDLRAHLRAISGYAQILHEDHNHQLDPDGLFILEKLQAASQKMNQVINSLLDLSRLERQELGIREIPAQEMSERIRNIFDTLAHVEPQRQVEFKIRSIPGCRADPDLLDQIWINLISNALKFTRKRAKAQVIVGSKECSSTNALATEAYFVEDNGVGFDMKYADKLFKVFERLHSSEEYEGSGVGLVIVERIISRHGGQIWVESAIDQGTTFYFTIP